MKPGNPVWVKSGPRQGWSGDLREIVTTPDKDGTQIAFVDWEGRGVRGVRGFRPAEPDIPLSDLEPATRLRLTCCPVGQRIEVLWLYPNRDGEEEAFSFFPKGANEIVPWSPSPSKQKAGRADWTLVCPLGVFGGTVGVRVRFCPGCGVKTPALRLKDGATSFHRVEADIGGTCLTCGVRYCTGESPSRVYEIVP